MMLEVIVRMQSATNKSLSGELCCLQIVNDETGTEEKGNYVLTLTRAGDNTVRTRVEGILREQGIATFVSECLLAVKEHLNP